MSKKGTDFLVEQTQKAVDYCRKEFNMTYAETVGALMFVISDVVVEGREKEEEEDDFKAN